MLKNLIICFFQAGFKTFLAGALSSLLLLGLYNDSLKDLSIGIIIVFFLNPLIYCAGFFLLFLPLAILKKEELLHSGENEIIGNYLPMVLLPPALIVTVAFIATGFNPSPEDQVLLLNAFVLVQLGFYLFLLSFKKYHHENK